MTSLSGTPHCSHRIHTELALTSDCRDSFDVLAQALAQCHDERVTGALCVVGDVGGIFHLRDGAVIAVESPGSPGAKELRLGPDSAEAQVVATAAIQDGAFAIAVGDVGRCVVGDSIDVPLLFAADGVVPELLLTETARRLDAIASLAFPLSPYRDRVVPARGVESGALTATRREIFECATGRRSARDIAFAVGRGLYPVTVEVSRMLGEELLEIAPPETSFSFSHWGLGSLRPRVEPGRPD